MLMSDKDNISHWTSLDLVWVNVDRLCAINTKSVMAKPHNFLSKRLYHLNTLLSSPSPVQAAVVNEVVKFE